MDSMRATIKIFAVLVLLVSFVNTGKMQAQYDCRLIYL